MARDITALGSPVVLTLLVVATCVLLLLARRVGDALLVRGIKVQDIMSATNAPEHKLTSFAKVADTEITYPAEE